MRVVLCLLLMSAVPLATRGADSTPFVLESQGGIVVPVRISGTGPYAFLVDTGASHSSISSELAQTVKAVPVARAMVSTPAGDRERLVGQVSQLGIGPIVVDATATVLPVESLRIAGAVAGILGQDVLAGLRYTIDYRRRHIRWDDHKDLDGRGSVAVLPLVFRDGLPVVELPHGGLTLRLVADSGSGGLVLFDGAGAPLPGVTADGGLIRVDGFQGATTGRSVRIDRFQVGASTFRDLPAVLLRRTSAAAHQGDGLLPLHLFDRVTFDGPSGRLIVG